jgi:predicted transcriptional regulator
MIVTLLARDTDEPFEVDPVLKAELLASIAEADRGELIPAEDVWKKLRERH